MKTNIESKHGGSEINSANVPSPTYHIPAPPPSTPAPASTGSNQKGSK